MLELNAKWYATKPKNGPGSRLQDGGSNIIFSPHRASPSGLSNNPITHDLTAQALQEMSSRQRAKETQETNVPTYKQLDQLKDVFYKKEAD